VFFTYMGEEGQQDLRPREQNIADFKDFINKYYPANQQQTFLYRCAVHADNASSCLGLCFRNSEKWVSAPSSPPQQTSMAACCNSSGSQQGISIRLPGVLTTRDPPWCCQHSHLGMSLLCEHILC
jgi:hypothetical protein